MFNAFTANTNTFTNNGGELAKLVGEHAQKFFAAQQSFFQTQQQTAQAQWGKLSAAKNPSEALETLSTAFVPAAQAGLAQAQALWNLSLEARNEISAKAKALTESAFAEVKTAVEKNISQLPNQGEPLVGFAKAAATTANGALEQVSKQFVEAQTAFEANVAKAFDQAKAAIPAAAEQVQAVVAKAKK